MRRATAFAPATVANVAVGFDLLGYAIEAVGDEVTVTLSGRAGVRVAGVTDATGKIPAGAIPLDPLRNTATVGLVRLLEDLRAGFGFDVEVRKGIALGSGMGGSAASAVAGLVAANALLARPLAKEELLRYALLGETVASGASHPDNAAPCLFGGLTLVTRAEPFRLVPLPIPKNVFSVLVHPHVRLDTRDARGVLSAHVPLGAHVRQSANLAGFVAALYTGDLKLLGDSLADLVIEPQRAALVPGFDAVKAAALREGALGASLSGSGPSVFAWATSDDAAARARDAMVAAFREHGVEEVDAWVSPVGGAGARVTG